MIPKYMGEDHYEPDDETSSSCDLMDGRMSTQVAPTATHPRLLR